MKARILLFWDRHPALFYGCLLFFGCIFALQSAWALLACVLMLHKKRLFQSVVVFLLPCCTIYQMYTFPISGSEVDGTWYIYKIHENTRFGRGWSYSGMLKTKQGRMLCRCFSKSYYPPGYAYQIQGTVRKLKGVHYQLKSTEPWVQTHKRFTLAAWRGFAQKYVKEYIATHIKQERASHFLTGMITGCLEDKMMMQEFSHLGLSHLMAISGLHFSLLALIFHLFLRLILPPKLEALCLILILTSYLLFIGDTPSIVRAWTTAMVFLLGQLLEKRSSGLNALGVALCLGIIWNPLSAMTLSFQLSFLATAGILFFYGPWDALLRLWLPKYALETVVQRHPIWQYGYILASFFREALALTLAVHLAVVPLLMTFFHQFSLSSLFYNLFFPFLASLALLFFLVSIPFGHWAHVANGYYCDWILRITETPPVQFTTYLLPSPPPWALAFFFVSLLALAIYCKIQKGADGLSIANDPFPNHL